MPRLAGKIALITGAASGIGRATAERFAAEGAQLLASDREEAGLAGLPGLLRRLDVTREADWAEAFAAARDRFGRVDILVNAAGIGEGSSIEETTLEAWRRVMAVNAEGTFLGCREAVRAMKETGGGAIVNISSAAGLVGDPKLAAYCASKGAVRLLTKSVALHCARAGYNIRCNSVHPSFAETPMLTRMIARAANPEKVRAGLIRATPIGRLGSAGDIAAAILYLASDEAAFVTGAELAVDGGLTAA
jgi:NAD(P)-dependent dehydrogenase (short-subunit alcohol dehydrogenase family)